ncbi:hypothetical protein JCM5350_000765 [Sporobolomyces pararoseus]
MASINWVILDSNTLVPVPLPREKVLLSVTSVSLHLFPSSSRTTTPSTTGNGTYKIDWGTLYLSNQRIVYVSPPKLQTGDGSTSSAATSNSTLETFSVPYSHFQDGRLNQPFFGANYFEATCLPAREGGLEGTHTIRFYFKEGGGFDFYSTVLEMKERLASLPRSQRQGRTSSNSVVGEDLPLYTVTPATPAPSAPDSTIRSIPSNSDLQAADVARQAENDEDNARTRPSVAEHPPPPAPTSTTTSSNPPPIGDDAPPSYTA